MIIIIDPGHGGEDPGAVYQNFIEKDLNLKVGLAIRKYLSTYNVQIIMTRDKDITMSPTARANMIKASKANLSICVHHNAARGDGCEVFYWYSDNNAKVFATLLINEFIKTGQNSRGIKQSKKATGYHNFAMCREPASVGIPAVLAEYAFVDNDIDNKIIDTDEELDRQGLAYANAAIQFLNLRPSQIPIPIPQLPATEKYEVIVYEIYGYKTALDAKNRTNPMGKLRKGNYSIFKSQYPSLGMINITGTPGVPGAWINPEDNRITPIPTPTPIPVPVPNPVTSYLKGKSLSLNGVPLYSSATSLKTVKKLTGTYFVYDGIRINGRIRITNRKSFVGKKPVGMFTTGWIAAR